MKKNDATLVLAVVLIAAFFFPWISYMGFKLSGFKLVFGNGGFASGSLMWITLLVPVGALLLLIGSLLKDSFGSSDIIFWMPLVGVIYLAIRIFMEMNKGALGHLTLGNFFTVMGYGFWITLIASILVLINRSRTDH
jgi:hypothetical protein